MSEPFEYTVLMTGAIIDVTSIFPWIMEYEPSCDNHHTISGCMKMNLSDVAQG